MPRTFRVLSSTIRIAIVGDRVRWRCAYCKIGEALTIENEAERYDLEREIAFAHAQCKVDQRYLART